MRGEEYNFDKKPQFIKSLFNSISKDYDKLNNIMTFGLHKKIKKEVIAGFNLDLNYVVGGETPTYDNNPCGRSGIPARQLKILDLCTGTGDLAGMLKEKFPNSHITGIDFSAEMLEIAREKYGKSRLGLPPQQQNASLPDIEFLEADCSQLPFDDESFDLCVISFGLRNVENIQKVLNEIYRVLKAGGIFINLDLGKPKKFFNFFLKPYLYLWVSFLGKFFHGDETPYKYLAVSNETFPSQTELVKIFEKTGFFNVKNKNYLSGQIASQICQK